MPKTVASLEDNSALRMGIFDDVITRTAKNTATMAIRLRLITYSFHVLLASNGASMLWLGWVEQYEETRKMGVRMHLL